jgi:chemotaxis signal transduction protein
VVVEAAGQSFGLPIAVVQDVVNVSRPGQRSAERLQRAPASIDPRDDTIDVGGERIRLFELRDQLGLAGRRGVRRTRSALVVQPGERAFGLVVDGRVEIVEIPCSAIEPVAPALGKHRAIAQRLWLGERQVSVLDVEQLAPATLDLSPHRH